MKATIVYILLFLSLDSAFSQNIIEYDFNNKDSIVNTESVNKIQVGDFYQIRITNINLNLWKVSLLSSDSTFSKAQTTPSFGNFSIDAVTKVLNGITPFSTGVVLNQSQAYKDLLNLSSEIGSDMSIFNGTGDIIKKRIGEEKNAIKDEKNALEKISFAIDDLKSKVSLINSNSLTLINTSTADADFLVNARKNIKDFRDKIFSIKENIDLSYNSYEEFSKTNHIPIASNNEFKTNDELIKKSYDKFTIVILEAIASISSDKVDELLYPIIFKLNNKDNTYTSLPIQYMGEQANVKISFIPRNDNSLIQAHALNFVFPNHINHYNVVGVSFYASNMYNQAFSTIEIPTSDSTSITNIKDEKIDKAEIGIAALLRHGKKFGNYANFGGHFTLGVGLPLSNKIKPRILLGGGLSFGKKHMLTVDVGCLIGYVERLSSVITLTQSYSKKPENITVSRLNVRPFLALGYTFQF